MYSICYVMVDGDELKVYNELLISICSLRKRCFDGNIYVLLDQETKEIIEKNKRAEFEQYQIKPVIVDVPEEYKRSKMMLSRFIKTSVREKITGDYLYLDTDTIIAEELPEVISEHEIAQVMDVHCRLSDMPYSIWKYHYDKNKQCGYTLDGIDEYFNSGIIWVKDTELTHKFYREWHRKWCSYVLETGLKEDQPALNRVNVEMGYVIQKLPDMYNVQMQSNPFPIQYLADAKIIHYLHSVKSTYMLSDKETIMRGLNDSLIQQAIEAPKRAFVAGTLLKRDDIREALLESKQYWMIKQLYVKYPKLFIFGEKMTLFLLKVHGKVHKKMKKRKRAK